MASSSGSLPSHEILVRGQEGFSLWKGPPFANGEPSVKVDNVACTNVQFSENGSKLMVVKSNSVISIYDCGRSIEIRAFEITNVTAAQLSPSGTYLQTFQKSSTPEEKNVSLWSTERGNVVYQHFQKNMTKATWPSIEFSSDEAVACRLVKNEIQFFDTGDFSKGVVYRLKIPGVATIGLSRSPGSHVAALIPESKGVPASVQVFACRKDSQTQPVARRSFFRCSTVQFSWNIGSTGLLAVAQSDVDKTNQSYYGESKLNYLTTDGVYEGIVNLRKEGPIHDVRWSYSGYEFAVVYGFMPAKATVFDRKCNPLLELGIGPYNTIRWNPKGKFLCLAGFGNLPGDMVFWDYVEKKELGKTKAEWSVTCEWSPDGCYLMTATTAPRLQVDNGIKIFHYNGSLYFKKMFEKLYKADWKPISPDNFPDIAELVNSIDLMKIDVKKPPGQAPKLNQQTKPTPANHPAQKPAAYRPPHAKSAAAVQAELFGENPSVGISKNALRNKKKREKQKEKKASDTASDDP